MRWVCRGLYFRRAFFLFFHGFVHYTIKANVFSLIGVFVLNSCEMSNISKVGILKALNSSNVLFLLTSLETFRIINTL